MSAHIAFNELNSSAERTAFLLTFAKRPGFDQAFREVLASNPALAGFRPQVCGGLILIDHTTQAGVEDALDAVVKIAKEASEQAARAEAQKRENLANYMADAEAAFQRRRGPDWDL